MAKRRYKRNPNVSRAARIGAPARRRSKGSAIADMLPLLAIAGIGFYFFTQNRSVSGYGFRNGLASSPMQRAADVLRPVMRSSRTSLFHR